MAEDTQQLGKYRILEELGRGGFATVYRALDTTLEREVALKVLDPLLMRDETWVEHFHREAKAVARLKHSHIVTIYEIGEAGGRLFIAMELVEGPGLNDFIAERGHLSWGETLNILAQVADALEYAHGEGILHRDLKPGNILLDLRRGVVLTDFGFARLVGESSMSVSVSGGVVGTPQYIAPEVWRDENPCPQTDLYALGCVVYEMLTGEVLFLGKTPAAVMTKHLMDGPQFPTEWPRGVPAGVAEVLGRALAREPQERHPGAVELVVALRGAVQPIVVTQPEAEPAAEVASRPEAPPPVAQPVPRSVRPKQREREDVPWAWGAGVAGLLVLVALLCAGVVVGPRLLDLISAPTEMPTELPTEVPTRVPTQAPTEQPTEKPIEAPTEEPAPEGAPANASLGDTWVRPTDDVVMVYVPGGEFEMGSTEGGSDERPVHMVVLDDFWIDRTEVTNEQYRRCVEAGDCEPPADSDSYTRDSYYGNSAYDDYPVIYVSWFQAVDYCEWAGGRLPTEAEWEYAARGPEVSVYPWGDEWDKNRLNSGEGGPGDTTEVGSYPAGVSWCGALDMAGNVWEWVADWYGEYPSGRQVNPTGSSSGASRVLRGGSWSLDRSRARSAYRSGSSPGDRFIDFGFRCCVSPTSSP